MKRLIIILLVLMNSCVKKEASQDQVSEFLKEDTISKIYYEDNSLKEIKLKDNKVKVFYRNGNLFKEGFVDKNEKPKGEWYYYTLEGKISEMREFNNFSGDVFINRFVYFRGDSDILYYEKDPNFNVYKVFRSYCSFFHQTTMIAIYTNIF